MAFEAHCINGGQGNSVVLRLPDDPFVLVDIDRQGDEDRYVRRLTRTAFTHPHENHISGLKPLVDAGFVFNKIWESWHG